MEEPEPQHPCVERTIALIYEAFDGVTREGGVSWSEKNVIDVGCTAEEREAARALDKDTTWQELIDGTIGDEFGASSFSWMHDPIGSRYYLAPAMIAGLRRGFDNGVAPWLNLDKYEFPVLFFSSISLLDERQIQSVCEFLKCLRSLCPDSFYRGESAYRSYWVNLDQNPI